MFPLILKCLGSWLNQATETPVRRISDAIPDVPVTNQFAKTFRFRRDFVENDSVLIINTMYTTCRGSCPGTSATIASLRAALSRDFGARLKFLSLTLEPLVDTPAKLLAYSKVYGAHQKSELCAWHFLTTPPEELDRLRRCLGFSELDPRLDRDITQHASLLLVINLKANRWCKLPAELREPVLIDSIRRVAGNTLAERFGIPS